MATFSILGYDPATGEVGGAVQSRVFTLNGVLRADADAGVVATQAIVDVSYGPKGIALLEQGSRPTPSSRRSGTAIPSAPDLDKTGPPVRGHRLRATPPFHRAEGHAWAGGTPGQVCTAQGNILAGPAVVANMVKAFEETTGHLSLRLMAALDAGQAAGGDTRGMQLASMVIVRKGTGVVAEQLHRPASPGGRSGESLQR